MLETSGQPLVAPTIVYNYWKEFDLETLRARLDEKGLAIAESQESSVKSRKQLADKTKEFKRSVPPEVFKQIGPLLKAYQEEVDALTGRAKLGEGAFLDVFKQLYEAPDPAPAIAQGLELASKSAEVEAQAAKTAQELAEYKAESKELKNQDLTIRRLEEKIRSLEAEVAEKDGEIDAAKVAAAAELEARTADEARAREERLEAELQRAEAALEAMRRMHQSTQSQLFNMQEKGEEAAAAARAEAELAAEEVERAQERLALLAQERDALLAKMDQETNGPSDGGEGDLMSAGEAAAVAALREELRTQRELNARLQSELSAASRVVESEQAAIGNKLAGLQASLQAAEAHAAALEAELAGRPTLQELEEARQQIRVLHAVVHNAVGEDFGEGNTISESSGTGKNDANGTGEGDGVGNTTTSRAVGSLESALLAKNRHLEHKLTMARLDVAEAQGAAENAAGKVAELEAELEKNKALVHKLEEDLVAAEMAVELATPGGANGGASGEGETEGLLKGLPEGASSTATRSTTLSGDVTMVSVLSGQRDRLRARVQELESAVAVGAQELAKAKQDVAAARADNIALVEQLRYVQGYSGSKSGVDLEAGKGVVNRYLKEYEERVNPLNDFRSKEREARRKALNIQDRAAVALGSALVGGSKVAKSAIIVYAFALHLIAFLVLAGYSNRQADKMDALEEMCEQLRAGGMSGTGAVVEGTDPVVGGAVAAVVQDALHALLRRR